jgi:hypothetical protein
MGWGKSPRKQILATALHTANSLTAVTLVTRTSTQWTDCNIHCTIGLTLLYFVPWPAREPRGRNTTRYIESLASCCWNKEHDIIVRHGGSGAVGTVNFCVVSFKYGYSVSVEFFIRGSEMASMETTFSSVSVSRQTCRVNRKLVRSPCYYI